jgi:DNA-binding response OmpR family regulator
MPGTTVATEFREIPLDDIGADIAKIDPALVGRCVLVVDDEPLVALMLEDHLLEAGCRDVLVAHSVDEATRILKATLPDAAVLDINLGGHVVAPVADALRAAGVPFLFLTGYESPGLAEGFELAELVQKPCNLGDLTRALVSLLPSPEPKSQCGRGSPIQTS